MDPNLVSESSATESTQGHKKKSMRWSPDDNIKIIQLRHLDTTWEDISKHFPGRTASSCRSHYRNYIEKNPDWDDTKKTKLTSLYNRQRKEMWLPIAKEMIMTWRAVETMHREMDNSVGLPGVDRFVSEVPPASKVMASFKFKQREHGKEQLMGS